MSGLAAAYYFVKNAGRGVKVLVLDNHDDFGGSREAQRIPAITAGCSPLMAAR
jgi:protoporphyrinogen oxidase